MIYGNKLFQANENKHPSSYGEGIFVADSEGASYLNKKGEVLVPRIFQNATKFINGLSVVERNGRIGILKNPLTNMTQKTNDKSEDKKSKSEQVIAKYSTQTITVNGELIKGLEVYSIAGHNYFKLRDIGKLADDKNAKFSVSWNGDKKLISIKTGETYDAVGTELQAGNGMDKQGVKSTAQLEVNGKVVELEAYTIEEQTYFQIRELGKALNFEVKWNDKTKTVELKL